VPKTLAIRFPSKYFFVYVSLYFILLLGKSNYFIEIRLGAMGLQWTDIPDNIRELLTTTVSQRPDELIEVEL
jgi:hypothetical protein